MILEKININRRSTAELIFSLLKEVLLSAVLLLVFIISYALAAGIASKLVALSASSYVILPSALSLLILIIPRRWVSLRFFFCTIVLILVAQEILFKDYSLSLADARYFNNTDLLSVGIKPFIVMASGYYAALLVSSRFEKFVFNKVLSRNGGIGLSNKIRS